MLRQPIRKRYYKTDIMITEAYSRLTCSCRYLLNRRSKSCRSAAAHKQEHNYVAQINHFVPLLKYSGTLRDKTMDDQFIYIPNVAVIYWLNVLKLLV